MLKTLLFKLKINHLIQYKQTCSTLIVLQIQKVKSSVNFRTRNSIEICFLRIWKTYSSEISLFGRWTFYFWDQKQYCINKSKEVTKQKMQNAHATADFHENICFLLDVGTKIYLLSRESWLKFKKVFILAGYYSNDNSGRRINSSELECAFQINNFINNPMALFTSFFTLFASGTLKLEINNQFVFCRKLFFTHK